MTDGSTRLEIGRLTGLLGEGFRVKDQGSEWEVDDARGCAVVWVQAAEGTVTAEYRLHWKSDSPEPPSGEQLEELQRQAADDFDRSTLPAWRAAGFVRIQEEDEEDWRGPDEEYVFTFWMKKEIRSDDEAADAIRWVKEQEPNGWISL